MSTPFPRTRGRRLGYDVEEVDRFLAEARAAFDARRGGQVLSAGDIRRTGFTMRRHGYATTAVDAAMERLEDALSVREREAAISARGERAWYADTRQLAKEIIGRLERADGRRFTRVGITRIGYSVRDVDRFAHHAREYFENGADVRVDEVRSIAFRAQRGGYSEAQVDLLVDGLVQAMLAVR